MKRIAALLAALGLLLAACGGASGPDPEANPKEALVSAFENLANSDGLEVNLSLDATPESLNALAGDGGEPLDAATAEKVLASSLRVLTKGKGEEAQLELVATIAGEEDLEIKVVDMVTYFRADAEGLMETFGADPSQLQMMSQQATAQGLTFVEPALNGEWIAVTGAEELSQQFGAADADKMAESQQKLIRDITSALEEEATVTNEGSDDAGDHLGVSIPMRAIYQRLLSSFQGLPGMPPMGELPPETEIPDENVVMDVWVDDDRVSQLGLDFAQFVGFGGGAESTGGRVALLMTFEEFDDDIEPPGDAVEVPAEQLMQLFLGAGGMGGATGGGMGAGGGAGELPADFDCDQLEGAPPAIKEQFADMCPDL